MLGPHSGSELGADFDPWAPSAYADPLALEEDELETGSESESKPEEDAETRFAAGFRPLWVCVRFLDLHMGRPVRGCAHGDRCTFAHSWAELHSEASAHEHELASRAYLSEAVVAACGPGEEGRPGGGGERRGRRSWFCRSSSTPRRKTPGANSDRFQQPEGRVEVPPIQFILRVAGRSCCAVVSTGAELVQVQFFDSG